jgi:hypothetical protein
LPDDDINSENIRMRTKIIAGVVGLISLVAVLPAQAQEAPTAGHGSVGALLGYGFKDGVGLGFGVRGGYTLPMNLYLGGTFVYHLGKSESTPLGDITTKIYYFGVEAGYDIAAGPVVIRPYAGVGDATATATIPGFSFGGITSPSVTASSSKFGFWPGATLIYPMGGFFVGGDARFLVVDQFNAFSVFATAGLQF